MTAERSPASAPAVRQDLGDRVLRAVSFLAGGGLAYGLFVASARSAPDQAMFLWTSVGGSGGLIALYAWHVRGRAAASLRWYGTLGLAVAGAVLAHLVLGLTSGVSGAGGAVYVVGASVGVGVPHGLVLGTAVALMLFGLRGPAVRRAPSDAREPGRPVAADERPATDEGAIRRAPPAEGRDRSWILLGLVGASPFAALFGALLGIELLMFLAVWAAPFAVCAATAAALRWMAGTGRPLRSRSIALQAVLVVIFACGFGGSLLVLVASPPTGLLLALVYGLAAALSLRAIERRAAARGASASGR